MTLPEPPRPHWRTREDPAALGLVRIVMVTLLLGRLLLHAPDLLESFSDASTLAGPFARMAFPGRVSPLFHWDGPTFVVALYTVGLVAHACWLVGWRTTPAAVTAWAVWVSLMGRQPLLYTMADQFQLVWATLLVLMPTGRGLGLDARRGRGGPVPVWCRGVLQLQLAVMYTSTGLAKDGVTWGAEGTALYYALSHPAHRHFAPGELWAQLQPWVLRPLTWLVRAWEVAFGPFVGLQALRMRFTWVPDLRWVFVGLGVAVHLGTEALLSIAGFGVLCLGSYTAFLRPSEVRRGLAAAAAMFRRAWPSCSNPTPP